MAQKYTEARRAANARFDEKTYKKVLFALRKEDDKDIIDSLDQAKEKGLTNREWLRGIFEGQEEEKMKKLYFVKTNAYNMIVSDDGETRRVFVENNEECLSDVADPKRYLLDHVEDDSSWEEYEEPIEEFTEAFDNEVLAEVEKEL